MPPSNLLCKATRSARPQAFRTAPTSHPRLLSKTAFLRIPQKGAEDRNSINTESSEHTKSSTDFEAAQQDQAAYDPSKTSPESQMESAKSDKEVCWV